MGGVAAPPPAVIRAALALDLDPARLRPLGGASAATWGIGDQVLRLGPGDRMGTELAAAAAAAAVLPVPEVRAQAEVDDDLAVLLERLPGRPAIEVALRDAGLARTVGRACATVHQALAGVPAPASVPTLAELRTVPRPPAGLTARPGLRLLHLDLHPFNLLASDDGRLTGVLDWANAAAGHPDLDRARTWSILTLDPAARARHSMPAFAALADGWLEGGRLAQTSPAARAWACRYMLNDLGHRYSAADLAPVRQAYEGLRHRTAST
jgi:aminoglycoside phosphotransferase (APT) family kinase protein